MNERLVSRSKRLSWLLRHGAGESGLPMDPVGWASVDPVLGLVALSLEDLHLVVEQNDKGRLELDGDRIRACQGHSTDNMPVTADALEASWERVDHGAPLFHGTYRANLASIAREGLSPRQRTHVHLAEALDSRVGKRASVDVALEIDPVALRGAGLGVYRAPNGVVLVRRVPRVAIVELHVLSRKAEKLEAELRRTLGLE